MGRVRNTRRRPDDKASTSKERYTVNRTTLGAQALELGAKRAAQKNQVSVQVANNWPNKHLDPEISHSNKHRGNKGKFIPEDVLTVIEKALWDIVKLNPTLTFRDYKEVLNSKLLSIYLPDHCIPQSQFLLSLTYFIVGAGSTRLELENAK